MRPVFYNQHSKFGRATFLVEGDELSISSRASGKRVERRIPLRDLHATIERGKERFGSYSLALFSITLFILSAVPILADKLKFIDEFTGGPVTLIYVWLFGLLFAGIFSYRAVAGLRPAEFVRFQHRHGGDSVLIAKDRRDDESFEAFVQELSMLIREAELATPADAPPVLEHPLQ